MTDAYYYAHVRIGEALDARGALPSTFMSLAPGSHHTDVWHDVNRMLTLNGEQTKRGLENHICPLQFDIVDRLIERYSNPDDLVFDPFGGLFTVPYRALKLNHRGRAVELSAAYFADGVKYLQAAEVEMSMSSLFDTLPEAEAARISARQCLTEACTRSRRMKQKSCVVNLIGRMSHVDECDQAVLLREVKQLEAVTDPQQAYAEWGIG